MSPEAGLLASIAEYMSLTDREYRKQFYNALNYLQSGRGKSEVDEYDQYYVPVYMDVENYFNPELPIDEGAFLVGLAAGFALNFDEDRSVKQRLWQKVI